MLHAQGEHTHTQTFICFISFRFILNDITHVIRRHAMHKGIEQRKQHSAGVKSALQFEQISPRHTQSHTRIPTLCLIVCMNEIFAFYCNFLLLFKLQLQKRFVCLLLILIFDPCFVCVCIRSTLPKRLYVAPDVILIFIFCYFFFCTR